MKRRTKNKIKLWVTAILGAIGLAWIIKASMEPIVPAGAYPMTPADDVLIVGMQMQPPNRLVFYTDVPVTAEKQAELTEYFLAALTIPEDELWVNLKPEEPNRVAPYRLATTKLGKVMLEQDMVLKITQAMVINPDYASGQLFYTSVDGPMRQLANPRFRYRTWIVPETAEIADDGLRMQITSAELTVNEEETFAASGLVKPAIEKIVQPAVLAHVRQSGEFTPIREAYRAVVCAIWFKNKFMGTMYGNVINQHKTGGFETGDTELRPRVWAEYRQDFDNKHWHRAYAGLTRSYGGVEFKKVQTWVRTERKETDLEGKEKFAVEIEPSAQQASYSDEEKKAPGTLGGIRLDAQIDVEPIAFPEPPGGARAWYDSMGIDYRIVDAKGS